MFLDILFPRRCFGCGFIGSYLCPDCQKSLVLVEKDRCFYCHRSSYLGLTHPGCRQKNGVDGFIAVYQYNNTVKKIIKNIKYRLVREAMKEFLVVSGPAMVEKLHPYKKIDKSFCLLPVPLHLARLRERGFNQSEVLTGFISDILGLDKDDLLIRKKNTPPQAKLETIKDRFKNLRGAFIAKNKERIRKRKLILVDDVVTSGITAREAVKTLKKAGAESVMVFSLAKGW